MLCFAINHMADIDSFEHRLKRGIAGDEAGSGFDRFTENFEIVMSAVATFFKLRFDRANLGMACKVRVACHSFYIAQTACKKQQKNHASKLIAHGTKNLVVH